MQPLRLCNWWRRIFGSAQFLIVLQESSCQMRPPSSITFFDQSWPWEKSSWHPSSGIISHTVKAQIQWTRMDSLWLHRNSTFPQSVVSPRHMRLSHNGQSPASVYHQSAASSQLQIPLRVSFSLKSPPASSHHGGGGQGSVLREEASMQNVFALMGQRDNAHLLFFYTDAF